jgi:nucleoside-diphosphate-sugar epimerase
MFALAGSDAIAQRPLAALADLGERPSLLLHLAFLGKERADQMDEPHYRAANRAIGDTVLGALDRIGVEAAFLSSSGAAAFADDAMASAAMRLYGAMKRDDEDAFAEWAETTGKRLAIARIHNLSGPHINKPGSYALACFIADAFGGGPIRVRAPHDVVRGYVAIRELMSLVFACLLRGGPQIIRFDTAGEPVELGALAELVSAQFGGCPIERPARLPGEDRYVGDPKVYRSLLQLERIPEVPLDRQVAETAAFLSAQLEIVQEPPALVSGTR